MVSVQIVFAIVILVCLFCQALGRPNTSPIALGWLGLFFWAMLSLLVMGKA
jgi:hypothetical protein